MPHRLPEYEQLWTDLERVLLPILKPFAQSANLSMPFLGPYPRFILERAERKDRCWIDLSLIHDSMDVVTSYSDDLPFTLGAGRVKQIREGDQVTAYELAICKYSRITLDKLLPSLEDDLLQCWQEIDSWTEKDFLTRGKGSLVPSYLAKV